MRADKSSNASFTGMLLKIYDYLYFPNPAF
jgi:hypothetical protein